MKKFWLTYLVLTAPVLAAAQPADTTSGVHKKRLAVVAGAEAAFYIGGMVYLSQVWYKDKARTPLHFYNDNAGWLQMDKFAHAYVAYHQSRAGYHLLRWSGVDKSKALLFGGTLGFVLQLPVEIFDGLYEGYGFSPGDVAANTFGSALFIAQEIAWDDQPIKMKFSFASSPFSKYRPGVLGKNTLENLVMDYNAQTYWFSANLKHFFKQSKLPPWLNLAIGYSGNGMLGEFENPTTVSGQPVPFFERHRQYFLSVDVDFSKIKTRSKVLKTVFEAINILKVPAPSIAYDRANRLQFHWFYY